MPQLDVTVFAPQLVWLAISFVVLYLLMAKVALPRVAAIVELRDERIGGNLDKAEKLKQEAEAALAAYNKAIAEARAAAQAIQREAQAAINAESAKREAAFGKKIADDTAAAEARIAAAKSAALTQVRSIATDLAGAMAEKLVSARPGADAAAAAVEAAMKERA
jgi:F-type H+-transporting ATPase subunit b